MATNNSSSKQMYKLVDNDGYFNLSCYVQTIHKPWEIYECNSEIIYTFQYPKYKLNFLGTNDNPAYYEILNINRHSQKKDCSFMIMIKPKTGKDNTKIQQKLSNNLDINISQLETLLNEGINIEMYFYIDGIEIIKYQFEKKQKKLGTKILGLGQVRYNINFYKSVEDVIDNFKGKKHMIELEMTKGNIPLGSSNPNITSKYMQGVLNTNNKSITINNESGRGNGIVQGSTILNEESYAGGRRSSHTRKSKKHMKSKHSKRSKRSYRSHRSKRSHRTRKH